MKFPCFGLHAEDGVMWLAQGNKTCDNALGLPSQKCSVSLSEKTCPHNIQLNYSQLPEDIEFHVNYFLQYSKIFRTFVPTPLEGSTYIIGTQPKLQSALSKLTLMSSPLVSQYRHFFEMQNNTYSFLNKLNSSNIQKVAVTGADRSGLAKVISLLKASIYSNGHLIMAGENLPFREFEGMPFQILHPEPNLFDWVETLDMNTLKLIGQNLVFKHMREYSENAHKDT